MLGGNSSDLSIHVGIFRAYFSPLVAALGLIGNAFIIAVFSMENPRTRFSIYAISLAIANAITLLTNTVFDDFLGRGLYYATNQKHYYKLDSTSEFGCKFVEYLSNVMFFTTSYITVIFSLDRLLTILRPIALYSIYHKRWAVGACITITLLGFISNTPLIFVQTLMVDVASRTNFTCRMIEEHTLAKFSVTFEVICTYAIPFCVVLLLNTLIFYRLWKLKHERRHLLPSDRIGDQLEMGRVAGHLASSTAFLLLYMPVVCFVVIRLHLTLVRLDRHSPYALSIIDLSRLFSSVKDITYAVNFPMYLIFLSNFRRRFVATFCPCVTTSRDETRPISMNWGSRKARLAHTTVGVQAVPI
ncbi:unnamed protein product [Dicrocoelium dendriticum]|nr:unnamed protein product [Dicrocoelium dendriticum]